MEKFVFLDSDGQEIPILGYSETGERGGAHHESVRGFVTILTFAAIEAEYLGVDQQEQTRLLRSIHSIREEHSGATATREQLIDALKADPFYFARNLRDLFRALPELAYLKQELRQKWSDGMYSTYIGDDQRPTPPQPS